MRRLTRLVSVIAVFAMVLAACGTDEGGGDGGDPGTTVPDTSDEMVSCEAGQVDGGDGLADAAADFSAVTGSAVAAFSGAGFAAPPAAFLAACFLAAASARALRLASSRIFSALL